MADYQGGKQPFFQTPMGMVAGGAVIALLVGMAYGLIPFAADATAEYWDAHPVARVLAVALLVLLLVIPSVMAAVYFSVGVIRWAIYGHEGLPRRTALQQNEEALQLLRSINERLLISDTAKRLASRQMDREALGKAIHEDIVRQDFEAAMVLVTEMSQTYGYRQEAEDFRDEITRARAAATAQQISHAIAHFEGMLERFEWDAAAAEAAKLQRLYPDTPAMRNLGKRARESRETHKHDLERKFLQAAERDDVELAIETLKELDRYLTESEAEPFRETARGVIGKKRQNLGVQFKLAVHDKEWTQAVRVGEQIIREFPNSKMSDEVRGMLDLLRERAAGEQAARPREIV